MEINDLKIFMKVVECGTIKEAAHITNSSASSIARAIQRLENEFGVELFIHNVNNMTINEFGAIVKAEAPACIAAMENLQMKVEEVKNRSHELKLQACDPGPAWFISDDVAKKLKQVANTKVYTDLNIAFSLLKNDAIDLLIVPEPIDVKGYTCQFMAHDKLLLSVDADDERFRNTYQISLQDGRIDKLIYFHVDGAFSEKLKKVYEKICKKTSLVRETEFWNYQARLKNKKIITTNTSMVSTYRNDPVERKFIPITDLGTDIDYYLVYKNSNRGRLAALLEVAAEWAEKYKG